MLYQHEKKKKKIIDTRLCVSLANINQKAITSKKLTGKAAGIRRSLKPTQGSWVSLVILQTARSYKSDFPAPLTCT